MIPQHFSKLYFPKELSWLAFNERVLQEAMDEKTPLIERIRFLGIYSNNLDEFYKVRYATVKRIARLEEAKNRVFGDRPAEVLLKEITNNQIIQNKTYKPPDSNYRKK